MCKCVCVCVCVRCALQALAGVGSVALCVQSATTASTSSRTYQTIIYHPLDLSFLPHERRSLDIGSAFILALAPFDLLLALPVVALAHRFASLPRLRSRWS